jgi:hypothetical protein
LAVDAHVEGDARAGAVVVAGVVAAPPVGVVAAMTCLNLGGPERTVASLGYPPDPSRRRRRQELGTGFHRNEIAAALDTVTAQVEKTLHEWDHREFRPPARSGLTTG